jgi:ATP-binding cassette subfamily B protein
MEPPYIMVFLFLGLIGTAMVSRIAKAFQDYVVNVITQNSVLKFLRTV